MYLKSLTARGFKSFADKVTLDFEKGISVIVGPNGSGKSNVADAVLWVLGEQSPRNLRGTKMEDVIFAGSATRQAQNMAEVSLSFDNRNGDIPIGFPEVVVTRRIFRTGESEYLLNKTPCRLVDIQELLSDLGVGRELTAVIGQNKLDSILRSQPEDRRAFIEEAAGLRKHRRRKEKSLRKIEGVERNLERVKDIMAEVQKQLRPLERQARQAHEYQELEGKIRDNSIRILVGELQELKGQWENRRGEEEKLARELEETGAALKEGKDRRAEIEARLKGLRQDLDGCREREMRLLSLGERLHACEGLGEERLKLYAALSGEIAYGKKGLSTRREELAHKHSELEEEHRLALQELSRLREEEESIRNRKKALTAELAEARRGREEAARSRDGEAKRCTEIERNRNAARERSERLGAELSGMHTHAGGLRRELEEARAEVIRLREETVAAEKRRAVLEGEMDSARSDIARFREEAETIARKQKKSYQEEALVVARLRALQEVFSSRIDYAAAAARVLEEAQELPGMVGMVLHGVRFAETWERALESYLGPWLFCVVTRELDDAVKAVRFLKRGEEGYGVFIPLSEISREPASGTREEVRTAGGIPALDAIECKEEIRPVVEYLLGDVVLCSSLEEAAARARLHPGLTFLTADGDVIATRGGVKGGALPRSPFHVVAKRREIEQLQEMLDLCDEESISLEVQRKSVLATIAGLEKDVERMEEERKDLEARLRDLGMNLKASELRVERAESELVRTEQRSGELKRELEETARRCEGLDREEAEAARALEEAERSLGEAERRVQEWRRKERELDEVLQEMRSRVVSLSERSAYLEERIAELEEEETVTALPGREDLAAMMRDQEEMLALIGRLARVHEKLAAEAGSRESKSRAELNALEEELEGLSGRLREMEAREGELRDLVHNRDLLAAQLKMRVDMLVQRLLDEYRVPLETALTEYVPERPVADLKEEVESLERRREMLGQVNLRAAEEHQALKERYDFLAEQVEDLRESKASLLKVVRAIDREIVRIFQETFDEVNQHFQELFQNLFHQGRAELVLSEPADLLNTGVEIEAQPHGKRLKKLSLLSGGETALISLAFLFALFKTRPSPFYFLDEVEAALDDVNLHRFLSMLKDFRGESQLIVITHQKRTMEIADILYGVSMQASGVSRVVSQKLEEARPIADGATA